MERLLERGFKKPAQMAKLLGVHVQTLERWGEHGLVTRHAYDGYRYVYEDRGAEPARACPEPLEHCG